MASAASKTFAHCLIGLSALGVGGAASAQDSVAGALFGAGAGAILGHAVGGPDAAIAGGIVGAVTGAALASSHPRGVAVHYGGGYAPPPRYYSRPRAQVYVVPPPAIVFVPRLGHGYWHHGYDAWGHPLRTWVPAPAPYRHYAPAPGRYDPYYRGRPRG